MDRMQEWFKLMEDIMVLIFRIACRLIFILVTITTLISVYHSRKNEKEQGAEDLSENSKEALLVSEVAFKVLVVMVPFLCIGCVLLFFVTRFKTEAVLLFAACMQIPIVFYALQKISPGPKGGE
jgi:Na+/H+ antiporter NhaD/arsenite permease-like protein